MKIKFAIISAIVIVAAIVTSVKTNMDTAPLLDTNVEALAQIEIQVSCNSSSPIIYCFVFCTKCNNLWEVPGAVGQYIQGSALCSCGTQL